MIKLKVTVTKEILRKSMMCGVGFRDQVGSNCAVALAIKGIFPLAYVLDSDFFPFHSSKNVDIKFICSSHNGYDFIKAFDRLDEAPQERLNLPETIVTLDIKEEILDELINQFPDYKERVDKSEVLELVE